jgi:hypothetical protein
MTLHPQGKAGVNISKAKYYSLRRAIVFTNGKPGDDLYRTGKGGSTQA